MNTIYATIYPKTTADQIQGLNEAIKQEIDNTELANTTKKGPVIIGDNITIDENNKISITAENIKNALNYIPASANSSLAANTANTLTNARTIQGVKFDGSIDINNYVICETEADQQIKSIELNNFIPNNGAELIIYFINNNTHEAPLLKINNNEEILYPIIYESTSFVNIRKDHIYHFIINNNNCQLINEPNIIFGVKGEANSTYKTGLINLDKNDIGLDQVDNTADSIKSVHYATYALKDGSGNDFDLYYCTNAEKNELNNKITENSEKETEHYYELRDKYSTTNDTLADLRTEILYNANHISNHTNQISEITDKINKINTNININDNRINDVYVELSTVHDDVSSIYDVSQTSLNNAAKIAEDLININSIIVEDQTSIKSAFDLIDNIDRNAETAKKDQYGNVIDTHYAPLNSPLFTGQAKINSSISTSNNNNLIATTKFVHDLINETLTVNTEVLSALTQIKTLLNDNTSLSNGILELIESKQERTDSLSNLLYILNHAESTSLIVTYANGLFDLCNITPFTYKYLSQSNASGVRQIINALGKNEKAVSAVNADTATNCIGNSLTANKLVASRSLSVTDGINTGDQIEFDGSDGVNIPLPKKIKADIDGISEYAKLLHNAKNIQVNLASTDKVKFDNDRDITPGVIGILPVEHGGTGVNNIDNITIGISKRIKNNINTETNHEKDIIFTQLDDEFARIRIDKNDNIGYLEIATADKANEPIYIRQYYGKFDTLERTFTILDENGNTSVPGRLTTNELIIPTTRPKNPVNGSIWIE